MRRRDLALLGTSAIRADDPGPYRPCERRCEWVCSHASSFSSVARSAGPASASAGRACRASSSARVISTVRARHRGQCLGQGPLRLRSLHCVDLCVASYRHGALEQRQRTLRLAELDPIATEMKAIIAVARTRMVAVYHMLRDGRTYRDLGEAVFEARDRDRLRDTPHSRATSGSPGLRGGAPPDRMN